MIKKISKKYNIKKNFFYRKNKRYKDIKINYNIINLIINTKIKFILRNICENNKK